MTCCEDGTVDVGVAAAAVAYVGGAVVWSVVVGGVVVAVAGNVTVFGMVG